MNCPKCKSENISVVDSRDVDERSVRRRRQCEDCKYRFTTYERFEPIKVSVLKRSGKTEPFEREKILKGIKISASGRLSDDQMCDIVDDVEAKIIESSEPLVKSQKIGNMVIAKLKRIDEVAYLRFASVYKNFQDIESFEEELIKLKK